MISLVIPLYNEEESLELLYERLVEVVKKKPEDYEIVFMDDGSTDNSLNILKKLQNKDAHVRVFSFRKNKGKAEALDFGFQKARGQRIVTLDADLQDKPSEIPKLIQKLDEGWDLVCGWRKNRKDTYNKIISSNFFNFIANILWGLKLHDYNCGLKAYTHDAAKSLTLYGGFHRFIPVLAFSQGFRVCEEEVSHEKRKFGKSKYGFSKVWRNLPDIFTIFFVTKYSRRPLHFFGTMSILFIFISIIIVGYLNILFSQGKITNFPWSFLVILLILGGFQIFIMGLLGDLINYMTLKKEYSKDQHMSLIRYSSDVENN